MVFDIIFEIYVKIMRIKVMIINWKSKKKIFFVIFLRNGCNGWIVIMIWLGVEFRFFVFELGVLIIMFLIEIKLIKDILFWYGLFND